MDVRTLVPRIRGAAAPPPPSPAPLAAVELRIETLVFHGFSRSDGQRAGAAFQHELARLVAAHGLRGVASLGAPKRLDAGPIAGGGRPESTGRRAARALHGGLRS